MKSVSEFKMVYDDSNTRWTFERSSELYQIIMDWFLEFSIENDCSPTKYDLILGLECWRYLSHHPLYIGASKTISFYDLNIEIKPDWTLNPNYLELKVS